MPQFSQWNAEWWICTCGFMVPESLHVCNVCRKGRYDPLPQYTTSDSTDTDTIRLTASTSTVIEAEQ